MRKLLLLLAVVVLLLQGCTSQLFDQRVSEGEIEYAVTYPEMGDDNVMAEFMPNVMSFKFKDNRFKTELSAGMGMFRTLFIADCETKKLNHFVKLVNKKYRADYDTTSVKDLNKAFSDYNIIFLDDVEDVAGYHCKKALVVFNTAQQQDFYIYYTNDIKITDPNWPLPFPEIEGVMLKYNMERNGIVMQFEAKQVMEKEIDDSEFDLPTDFELIDNARLDKELNEIFETFNY